MSQTDNQHSPVRGLPVSEGGAIDLALAHHVQQELAVWWDENARDLPWRFGRTSPWGVLVSEVMSQQTQMSRVVPYWLAWMEMWPSAQTLAKAGAAEVITAWGRLGYPRRALRLQECARQVSEQYGGSLPDDYNKLLNLPGIGDYTASAVLSFAFNRRIVVLDTNIRRVLTRVFLGTESFGGAATEVDRGLAESVLPFDPDECNEGSGAKASALASTVTGSRLAEGDRTSVSAVSVVSAVPAVNDQEATDVHANGIYRRTKPSAVWNQSVMELGALVCTAKSPVCKVCPIADSCAFLDAGLPNLGERRTRPRQHFKGTNRQVRGKVLEALRLLGGGRLSRKDVEALWPDLVQLDVCIASLDEDGLIVIYQDGSLSLPR